jgi:signal transduction histidine kinase
MVGVSVDRGGLHSVTTEREQLSCDLNTERSQERIVSKRLAAKDDKVAEEANTLPKRMMQNMSSRSRRERMYLKTLDAEKTNAVEEINAKLHNVTTALEKLSCDFNREVEKRSHERICSKRLAAEQTKAAQEADIRSKAMMQTMSIRSRRERMYLEIIDAEKTNAVEEANARSETMIQTMSILSHELRTPLQVRIRQ